MWSGDSRAEFFDVCQNAKGEKVEQKLLTIGEKYDIILKSRERDICWCGSMAEQLICNQQVVGSTPITSSIGERSRAAKGGRL